MSPDMVRQEMASIGVTTASLFNQQPQAPAQVLDPQKLANEEAIARAKAMGEAAAKTEDNSKAPEPTSAYQVPASKPGPTFFEELPADEKKESAPVPQEPDEVETDEGLSEVSLEHFKKLKTNYKEVKKTVKELEAQKREVDEKLKKYVPPEVLEEKERKIQELSRYEKLHNLKSSSEYKEKFLKPLSEKHSKLKEIFKDYGVPEEALDQTVKHALSFNNHAELNSFLADHFTDQLGAGEAKSIIGEIRSVESEARAAEAEPERVLQSLHEASEAQRQAQEAARREHVSKTARSAWEDAIADIYRENEVKELIYTDDPEFNATYPEKLLKQAATEYGKVITEMAKDGVTPSKEVAKALAKMTALSQVAGVSIHTRNWAMERAEELERNSERTSGLYRPDFGGGVQSRAPVDQGAPKTVSPEDELKRGISGLVNTVLSKR